MAMRPPVPSFCEIGSILPGFAKAARQPMRPAVRITGPAGESASRAWAPLACDDSVNVAQLVRTSAAAVRAESDGCADFVLDAECADPVVACDAGALGHALKQVLRFAALPGPGVPAGSSAGKGAVHVATREAGSYAEIRIRNTGVVISEATRMLEAGADSGADGLALAYAIIVEGHGGQMYFESDETRGTTFFVRLPLGPAPGGR